ncbi:MAG: methyltransferase domain-containing protein [Flavobacterium sp.]|nr:methyltransferase domain-containing protein [Flavobacterium sp.]
MMVSTKYRSTAPEAMDDFDMEGELLRDALDKIAAINQILGGNRVTLQGVKELIGKTSKQTPIHILDLGCGNGDMLRTLADWGKKNGYNFRLTGIDANDFTIEHAQNLSKEYGNIDYVCADIFEDPDNMRCDIALCTLTLHHFKDDEIIGLVGDLSSRAKMGIVINDLHRNILAYNLFKAVCFTFGLNEVSEKDGLVSILRGFKKKDLTLYSKQLNLKKYTIRWKWAFRYQWIISNI